MLPYLILGLGAYLLYDEIQKGKESKKHEKRDTNRTGGGNHRRPNRNDPKPNRNRVKEVKDVIEEQPVIDPCEPGDTGGSQPSAASTGDSEGSVDNGADE